MGLPSSTTQQGSEGRQASAFRGQDEPQDGTQTLHESPDPQDVKAGGDLREHSERESYIRPMGLHMTQGYI